MDINQALADQGLAPYGTLSGYVEIDYQWPWDALCATIVNVDVAHSVIFNYSLQMAMPATPTPQEAAKASAQTLEGLWWKQEANVTGFVALTNPGSQAISVSLVTSDSLGNPLLQNAVTVSPHGTKMVSLSLSPQSAGAAGGLRVVYTGSPNDLLVSGGLRDDATGYSANISFAQPPSGASQASAVSAAAIGLMTGGADPMLSFPTGTVFTPYAVVRNISSQPISFTPNFWWMAGGLAKNAALSQVSLAPYQALNLDVPLLLASAGLKNYNGSVNLVLNINADSPRGATLFSTGSVDRNNTYVFQVNPGNVKESIAKSLSYWSTANGDDTMVTLWNPADEAQDFLFTLFYAGGHYKYPLHLEPRATSMFNVSEILHLASPDADGNVIPAGVQEGSAELSGSQGEAQHILVTMDAGVYNVQKATCGWYCETCQGAVDEWVVDDPFALAVSATHQLTFTVQNNNGAQFNDTSAASWSSTNTSVATVSTGLVHGLTSGSLSALTADDGYPLYTHECSGVQLDCPINQGVSSSSPGNVITISQSTPLWYFGSGVPTPSGFTLGATSATLTANGGGNGSYSWTITAGTLQVQFSDNSSSTITKTNVNTVGITSTFESTQANDVTVQLQYTPSGASQSSTFTYSLSVDSPYKLVSGGSPIDLRLRLGSTCQTMTVGSDGYASGIPYKIISFFGIQISNIYVSELFGARHDSVSNTWVSPVPGSFLSTDGTFADCLLAVNPSWTPPTKTPQSPLLSQAILDILQTWYVGSATLGAGFPVQFDDVTYYQDHGRHLSVSSPVR